MTLSIGFVTGEEQAELPGWRLVWRDEFDGDRLDSAKWARCRRGTPDWQNTMSGDERLLQIEDGILRLSGIKNDREGDSAPFLTAGITSEGKYSFLYGKVVIRARFKCAQGAWPALWMLGDEHGWPAGGEIDLMEHLNFEDRVFQTVHSSHTVEKKQTDNPPSGSTAPIASREGWNTYGCEWSEDKIVFTVNGKETHSYPRVADLGAAQWPFRQPFYFIFSMQVGGGWVNQSGPTNPEHYPAWMEVDWVRVYEREDA